MADVFVSHCHKDRRRLEHLVGALEEAGLSVFWSKRLQSGWIWRRVLEHEIKQARCMIVIWSTDAVKSDWVVAEADLGKKLNILKPARIDDVEPPLGLDVIHAVDLVGWTGDILEGRWVDYLAAIRKQVANTAAPATAAGGAQEVPRHTDGGPGRVDSNDAMSPRRRRFLIGGGVVALAALPVAELIRRFWSERRKPRFRNRKGTAAPTPVTTPFTLGFYRNPRTEVVHYVSRAWYPLQQRFVPRSGAEKPRQKRRRNGHEEPRLHFEPVPRVVIPPKRNSEQLVIRDVPGLAVPRFERVDESRLPEAPTFGAPKSLVVPGVTAKLARKDAIGKAPHVAYRRASFSFEQAALLHLRAAAESAPDARHKRVEAALDLLLNGIAHDLAWKKRTSGRPSYRLLDLTAAAAVHHDHEDAMARMLGMLEPERDRRVADRLAKWSNENGEWRLRVKSRPISWAGLPT